MKERRRNTIIFIAGILSVAVAFTILSFVMRPEYITFVPGQGSMTTSSGKKIDTSPSFPSGDTLYIPLNAFLDVLGGKNEGDTIRLKNISASFSELSCTEVEGTLYCPLQRFIDRFSLEFRDYGDLIQIGFSCSYIPYEKRVSLVGGCSAARPAAEATPVEDIVDPYNNISSEMLAEYIAELERAYPDLITSFSIGTTLEGRDIPAFTFGKGERVIYYGASIHAGEHVVTNVVMEMVDRYAYGYYADIKEEGYISYRDLLDNVTFYIVPMINPDGVNIAQNGFSASTVNVRRYDKQGVTYAAQYKANANGVDLNRNFPYKWDPSKENRLYHKAMRYFCGFEANSEPEVQGLVNLAANIPWEMFADFHKFGEEFFWVDTDSLDHIERYGYIADRLSSDIGYELHHPETIEGFGGYCSNYMRNTYDRFSLTVETCYYWNYNPRTFDKINKTVWRIGLIMGEELLSMPDEVAGLRIVANGRTLPVIYDASMSDHYISRAQLDAIAERFGITLDYNETTVYASLDARVSETEKEDMIHPDTADVYAILEDGKSINVTRLFSALGIGVTKDGKTVYADRWV